MIRNILILALVVFATPTAAFAAVRINEVAWMGIESNANAEWIEISNDENTSVSLAGWTLTSSTGSPNIVLTGSIPALGYYLLTRTSVNTVPGVTGDQAYTGALSNSGTTLTLANAESTVVDEVVGGANWEDIGGDNTTKKTPQRGESGWVTATPTPKAPNAEIAGESTDDSGTISETEATTTTPTVTIGGSVTNATLPTSLPKLYVSAGSSRVVSAFAETPFRAYIFDEKGKLHKHAQISWSFGDGVRETGREVTHTYENPGTYLVVVRAQNEYASALRTLTVEVTNADVSIGTVSNSGIELINNSEHIADISGWYLKAGSKRFRLPQDMALLPSARITIAQTVSKLNPKTGSIALLYPGDVVAYEKELSTIELLSERTVAQ